MTNEKVLISGAGVAGSILAFFLAKHDFNVTVVERSRASQKLGQGIEIEDPALQVVKAMGIMDELEKVRTGELGFQLEDETSRPRAVFPIDCGFSPTGALEMMRGDLVEVLYKAADRAPNVTYHFETTMESLRETDQQVIVDLVNRTDKSTRTEEFDFVIGADGINSQTRQLVMGSAEKLKCFKPVGAYISYFSVPKESRDWPYSRLCHFPKNRIVWMRPIGEDSTETSVALIHLSDDIPKLREANIARDRMKQKACFAEIFAGLGWEAPRVIEQMMSAKNFYSDELMQVKLQSWSQGRVALVGDAAWAPTPFTGEGNQLAVIGAFVLAQEMSRNRSTKAFGMYENRLRSYVENAQTIPFGGNMPRLFCPETSTGIWVFRTIFWAVSKIVAFLSWMNLQSLIPAKKEDGHGKFDLQIESAGKK